MINWIDDTDDGSYFIGDIKSDYAAGLAQWLVVIAQTALKRGGSWNVLVADLWPNDVNYCRLIGHVQMDNVAVGYDTGFRFSAELHHWGKAGIKADSLPQIEAWLKEAVKVPTTRDALRSANAQNPFELRVTSWGAGDIKEAIKIDF